MSSPESAEQIDQKAAAIKSDKPSDINAIISEIENIDKELDRLHVDQVSDSHGDVELSDLQPKIDELKKVASDMSSEDCRSNNYQMDAFRATTIVGFLRDTTGQEPFQMQYSYIKSGDCRKTAVSSGQSVVAYIDTWYSKVRFDLANSHKIRVARGKYEKLLESRKDTLNTLIRDAQEREGLTGNFIWFIILFGALSLGAMIVVSRLFNTELQREWVSSGQVTQFVTVMILLTVVTMLGLSKTISSESLGTLLGGVAGYVLAQGVGRAAARDASRDRT